MPLKVWSKFSVTKTDGTVLKLRIQDMPSERYEDVIDFYIENFLKSETFHKAAGTYKNPEALQELRYFLSNVMKDPPHHLTICCRDDSEVVEEILGVSVTVYTTDDKHFALNDLEFKTQELQKLSGILEKTCTLYDIMKEQDVKTSYAGRGMAVHPDYRGLGIATEFCKVRVLTCKERGVPLAWGFAETLGSQKVTQRAGWQTAFQVPFADLEQRLGVTFEGAPQYFKIMFFKV